MGKLVLLCLLIIFPFAFSHLDLLDDPPTSGVIKIFFSSPWDNNIVPYIHFRKNNENWTLSPGVPMIISDNLSYSTPPHYQFILEANSLEFVFNDGNGRWLRDGQHFFAKQCGVYGVNYNFLGEDTPITSKFSDETISLVSSGFTNNNFSCFGRNVTMACGAPLKGTCTGQDHCDCVSGYFGQQCEEFECSGIQYNDTSACSGVGKCLGPNYCLCSKLSFRAAYYDFLRRIAPQYDAKNMTQILDQSSFLEIPYELIKASDDLLKISNSDCSMKSSALSWFFFLMIVTGLLTCCAICCILSSPCGLCLLSLVAVVLIIALLLVAVSFLIIIILLLLFCSACCLCWPLFRLLLKQGIRKKVKQEKEELLQNLLEQRDEAGSNDAFEKIDMSFYNLDYNDYKIERDIGSGGSGALCFQAIDKKTNEPVFMKMFSLKMIDGDTYDMKEFQNEVQLFTTLRHANIVTFYGFFCSPPSRVGYICEFCSDGTLSNFIKSKNLRSTKPLPTEKTNQPKVFDNKKEIPFEIDKKINYLIQISKGMRYLHQKGVIFRDLKPDNVLIGMNDTLKLTDFGISKAVNQNSSKHMTSGAGTSLYIAPEVTAGQNYDQKVDVFSFGIMIYDVLFETIEPYGPNAIIGIDFKISQEPNFRPEIPKDILKDKKTEDLILLMKNCWDHDPNVRPDFREIVLILNRIEGEY